jgi:hypothetical protein
MLTLGVDLSSQDVNTGICVARWENGRCTLDELKVKVGDVEILRLMQDGKPTGIDAPFGWPARFVAAVTGWMRDDRWTDRWDAPTQRALRLRETDLWVHAETKKWPLSVSADSIAMCAMRAVTLLHAAHEGDTPIDRVNGPSYEVYPGAALVRWDLTSAAAGYKNVAEARARLVQALEHEARWLVLDASQRAKLIKSDHAIDALLSAFVARAAATGATDPPPSGERAGVIAREGWIHLPNRPLEALA